MFITNPFAGAFGLDIGDLSLKLVQLYKEHSVFGGERFRISEIRTVTLPPGLIVNGEIQQPEMVRHKLLHLLGQDGSVKKISSPWVVADLPEPKTFLKLIDIELPYNGIAEEDVVYQARKHLPYEVEETYLDWQVVTPDDGRKQSRILIGAVPKVTADSYTYLLESVGLNVLALEIEGLCIARSLITRSKDYQGEARAILDLGATRASILIYDQGSIQFSTSFNFSGEIMTIALTQALHLEYEEAEKLKIANGLTQAPKHPKYATVMSRLISNLVVEINAALDFYKERFSDTNPVTHITMCGGLSNLKNLDTVLSNKLKISTAGGNAWKNILLRGITPAEREQGLTLVSALGLGLRAVEHPLPTRI